MPLELWQTIEVDWEDKIIINFHDASPAVSTKVRLNQSSPSLIADFCLVAYCRPPSFQGILFVLGIPPPVATRERVRWGNPRGNLQSRRNELSENDLFAAQTIWGDAVFYTQHLQALQVIFPGVESLNAKLIPFPFILKANPCRLQIAKALENLYDHGIEHNQICNSRLHHILYDPQNYTFRIIDCESSCRSPM